MSRELLIMAILDESYGVKMCYEHPEIVRYDEPECPACRIQYEVKMDKLAREPRPRKKL